MEEFEVGGEHRSFYASLEIHRSNPQNKEE